MDTRRVDHVARAIAVTRSRRRLLVLLALVPVLGGVAALPNAGESAAKDRRRRRKQRHDQRKDPGKQKPKHGKQKKGCKPQDKATVCAGQCGPVSTKQTCGTTIDCGPCDCPTPCAACFVCDAATRTCIVDPGQVGEACGNPGQVCASDGTCACDATSCPGCTTCERGVCAECDGCCDGGECVTDCGSCRVCDDGQCHDCPGCCDGSGVCQEGDTDAACGQPGQTCAVCNGPESPDCVDRACVCSSNGEAPCTGGNACCATGCSTLVNDLANCGACGNACANSTPICHGTTCVACSTSNPCPAGQCCAGDGSCVSSCPGGAVRTMASAVRAWSL